MVSTGLCVATDTVSFISAVSLPVCTTPFISINYIYDIDLLLNICFINASFADWRKRLWPWSRANLGAEVANADYISTVTPSHPSVAAPPGKLPAMNEPTKERQGSVDQLIEEAEEMTVVTDGGKRDVAPSEGVYRSGNDDVVLVVDGGDVDQVAEKSHTSV